MYSTFEALMKQRGENFSDVARAIGCRPSTLTDWRAGRYVPKRDKLEAIAKHYGVSYEVIAGTEPSPILELSHDEWMLIDGWRALNDDQREAIGTLMKTFLAQKRESDSQHEEKMA